MAEACLSTVKGSSRETLEGLIEQEYHTGISTTCKDLVIGYISSTKSVSEEDIIFIKRLTKIGKRILVESPDRLDMELAERLYKFHLEGISKVQKGEVGEYASERIAKLLAHLHTHASDILMVIMRNSSDDKRDISLLSDVYNHLTFAGGILKALNPEEAAIQYSVAGDSANDAALLLGDKAGLKKLDWLKKAYHAKRLSAETTFEVNPVYSAHKHFQAGEAAKSIFLNICSSKEFTIEQKAYWANLWYENKMAAASIGENDHPLFSIYRYGEAADACLAMYTLTKTVSLLYERYRIHQRVCSMVPNTHPRVRSFYEGVSAETSRLLFSIEDCEQWKKRENNHERNHLKYKKKAEKLRRIKNNFDP